jgi:predicted MPP superfamily phosphohydrolase
MLKTEMIAVFLFLGFVALVYSAEFIILARWIAAKIQGRPWKAGWRSYAIHGLSVIGILCFAYGYFVEPYRLEVAPVTIRTDKLAHARLRVVQFSDTHCDRKIRNERKLVDLINSLDPDVIVFTGDTLNTPEALDRFRDMMKSSHAGLGKYAVRGNFDVWYWSHLDLFGDTGFTVLDRDSVKIVKDRETVTISGLSLDHEDGYGKVLDQLSRKTYNIFLYHYPDLIEDVRNLPVDLYLAGHTHGGQIALPFYGALVTLSKYGKKYEAGRYSVGETVLYVNRGIGMEGGSTPRVRFWARPEITVFDIVPK